MIKEIDKQFVANTYNRFDVELVSGKGSVFTDVNGKEYIDLGSGIGVTAFGACDEKWIEAVCNQASTLQHTSNLYYTKPCACLAQMLCEKTGFSKVFFSNSGAEANECAIKVARKYACEQKGSEYYTIITLNNSFHGRTLTTLAATGQEHFHTLFNPLTPGFVSIDAEVETLEAAISKYKAAAVMLECVQGEGGVIPLSEEFIKAVRRLCDEHNMLMLVDEVQTGNGRCGELYAYQCFDVMPDVVSTAKGLAGGLPLGATMLSKKVENILGFGDHGSTFGGNPVSCAAAISILERLDREFLDSVQKKSKLVFDTLAGAEGIISVTGKGLMLGIKTQKPAAEVVKACIADGVLCLTAKDKVRLLPALNIPEETLKKALEIIKKNCK
ncbi:MAG: acetylornithine/succinylornithine family transaminase [Clostridia bacterium]|nr:acetylornithine/succinylornithine family transaminase [Clostridia bacterium]